MFSAKEAVAAMIKRLAHRNANVQLYTLEVREGISIVSHLMGNLDTVLLTSDISAGQCPIPELWS